MTFASPHWLLLLAPLALLWWWLRPGGTWLRGLRLACYVLIVVAMAEPRLRLPERAGTVVVLADRSASMPADAEARQLEAIQLLHAGMSPDDRLAVVTFGQDVSLEQAPAVETLEAFKQQVGVDASNLAAGLRRALTLIPHDGAGRILLLSDGRYTGPDPRPEAARAAARGVAVDHRELSRPAARDLAVTHVDAPSTVAPGESFMITGWVNAPIAQEVDFELSRGDTTLASGQRSLPAGLSRLTFRDTAPPPTPGSFAADPVSEDPASQGSESSPGSLDYQLRLTPREAGSAGDPDRSAGLAATPLDPLPENNLARFLVGVTGPRPLLLVTDAPGAGLARLLAAGGVAVVVREPDQLEGTLQELADFSGLVLENVSATDLPSGTLEQLAALVNTAGVGLAMTGGQRSFGPGGYFKSPLDPLLPVSMELRQEHRKLSLAIVVALDRSGSMSMTVPDGRTKMDLANLGTAQVLDLLGPTDEIGVIAVDSAPHTILNLSPVTDKAAMKNRILSIDSMGGGIYVYEALAASAGMLANATPATRHIILFADAQDSEQPGQYRELLEKAGRANITVSVIGLGQPTDVDADLLRDVASRGGGRVFFTDDPKKLPQLFAQDTFVVARSSFIDELTPVRTTGALAALTGRAFTAPPPVGGYNLNYLKPEAQLALATTDDYAAPLVATWNAGVGRVAVYTGEADGEFTGPIAGWPQLGDLLTSLARWIAADDQQLPDAFYVRQRVEDGHLTIELFLPPEAQATLPQHPRLRVLLSSPGNAAAATGGPVAIEPRMQYTAPDVLSASIPLTGQQVALASLDLGPLGRTTLSPARLLYSPEYQPRVLQTADAAARDGRDTLDELARTTRGQARPDLATLWSDLPAVPRPVNLAHYLWLAAVVVLLLEIFERRTAALSQFTGLARSGNRTRPAQPSESEPVATRRAARRGISALLRSRDRSRRSVSVTPKARPQPASNTKAGVADPPTATTGKAAPPAVDAAPPASSDSILSALDTARKQSDERTRR